MVSVLICFYFFIQTFFCKKNIDKRTFVLYNTFSKKNKCLEGIIMKKKKVVKIDVFKFIRSVVILFVFMLVISLFIGKVVYSHDDISVKGVYVKENDTLWSIATKEQENNEFYKGKSVYYVMDDIKEINNLDSCDLYEGQVLSVNTY